MFGICLLHSISQAGHNIAWAANMLSWCVPGFMFISGWFGIKFSVSKVLKLYGISFYCATIYVMFDTAISGGGDYDCIIRAYHIAKGQWFLNAYVIVMCLAPMVNLALDRMTKKELMPILLCAFGWSFATTLPVVSKYIPKSAGLTSYSFLTLLGVYVMARFVRKLYDSNERFMVYAKDVKILLAIIAVCLSMAAIGLGDYNSPFAIMIAGGMLFVVKNSGVPSWLGRVCMWLGPSMFSVYLLHSHGQAWWYLKIVQDFWLVKGVPIIVAYLMTALIVFSLCVVADLPRRGVVFLYKKLR